MFQQPSAWRKEGFGADKSSADVQMHACAAGYFSCVTTQQLVASEVTEQYILFAMGSSIDAAALSIRMQSLQQVRDPCARMHPNHTMLKCQEHALSQTDGQVLPSKGCTCAM